MASIAKRRSGGRTIYTVRWRDGGRGSKAHRKTFEIEEDALEFQLALTRTRQTGKRVRPASTTRKTIADAIDAYQRGPGKATATTTQTQRADVLNAWVRDQIGAMPLTHLDRPELELWRDDILAAGCSVIQANRARSALSTVLTSAASRGWIAANPILGWRALSEPKPEANALSITDIERIRRHLPTHRDRTFLAVMALAGLRTQEALALRWNDVHPASITVTRAYVDGEFKATKTGTSRAIPIPHALSEDLRQHRPGGHSPHSHARGGLVFPSSADPAAPLDLHNWRARIWHPAVKKAIGYRVRVYDARHTYASLALHAGITPMELHHRLGHASWTTTIKHYSHIIEQAGIEDREPIDDAIQRARAVVEHEATHPDTRGLDRLADAVEEARRQR
jgi:integrase